MLLAAVAAFRPTPAALTTAITPPRSSTITLQYGQHGVQQAQAPLPAGWTSAVDAASGTTYYCFTQTGQCQWEWPAAQHDGRQQDSYPQQQGGYGAQGTAQEQSVPALCRLTPTFGVTSEYAVRNGEEQVVGRYDMVDQDGRSGRMYVSRAQCLIQVDGSGRATLTSIGKNPTGLRRRHGAPWYGLSRDATHVLLDGEQIALNVNQAYDAYTAVFTVQLVRDEMGSMGDMGIGMGVGVGVGVGMGGYGQQGSGQQGGYPQPGGY